MQNNKQVEMMERTGTNEKHNYSGVGSIVRQHQGKVEPEDNNTIRYEYPKNNHNFACKHSVKNLKIS